ncbi:MAG: transglutaminase domain-containing protein, partial [Gemmatimonadetes bacterium]|nr:transglutaminase domain-containing protein [Gemmatimonadota bacterium]
LTARAHESLGQQEAARRAYGVLLANFPRGRRSSDAHRAVVGLTRSTYEVTLDFRFANRGAEEAEQIRFRVQAAQDFPPYSTARLLDLPPDAVGRQLADGTRYFSFEPFSLAPGQERTLRLRYAVAVSAESYAASASGIDGDSPDGYLQGTRYIESDAPEIRSLAATLAPAGAPARVTARRFYDFVLERLSYAVQPATHGALGALARPGQADCTEFAALFIALNRAAGIPSRPVFGYLAEPNRETYEISHLWAEFWEDGTGWLSADPTNGTLEPDRYFARVESNAIPLWVPSPAFGDLAGVRVSYRSSGEGDPLFTELVAGVRHVPSAEFEATAVREVAFSSAGLEDVRSTGARPPLVPTAAFLGAAIGFGFWHRRGRAA